MKKTFLEKQVKVLKRNIFENDLENFRAKNTVVEEKFDKQICFFEKGGTKVFKNRYTVTYKKYSNLSYNELVDGQIREKYSSSEEFAILRKAIGNQKNEEYVEYNAFAEECKTKAKAFIEEREGV